MPVFTQSFSCRLEEEKGIRIRFTTGLVPDEYKDEIAKEEAEHGEFLHIPIKVSMQASLLGALDARLLQLWAE